MRIGDLNLAVAAKSDGLQTFRTHHRADTAPTGMTPIVTYCCVTNTVFTGRADGGDMKWMSLSIINQRTFGFFGAFANQVSRVSNRDRPTVQFQVRPRWSAARDHQGIDTAALKFQGKKTRRERIGDKSGERRFGDDRKLGRGS